jgi:glycosyltransferase involved in cell wall biosynthesis
MRCPTLAELPPPPPGKTGWPWMEESEQLPDAMPAQPEVEGMAEDGSSSVVRRSSDAVHRPSSVSWPRISIVTPSYNQGQFIEETIRSVLLQGYPNLEYMVIDGGSTDESVEIIKKYEPWLAYWVSEPDEGQYDAINKGFGRSSGEIMAWINSDDMYTPWALDVITEVFTAFPKVDWLTTLYPLRWDEYGKAVRCTRALGYSRRGILRGDNLPSGAKCCTSGIQQESTFWRRRLWERAGGYLDNSLSLAGDYDLWLRFAQHAEIYALNVPLGGYRNHTGQKLDGHLLEYRKQMETAFARSGERAYGNLETFIRRLVIHWLPKKIWGFVSKIGLSHPTLVIHNRGRDGGWEIVKRSLHR